MIGNEENKLERKGEQKRLFLGLFNGFVQDIKENLDTSIQNEYYQRWYVMKKPKPKFREYLINDFAERIRQQLK